MFRYICINLKIRNVRRNNDQNCWIFLLDSDLDFNCWFDNDESTIFNCMHKSRWRRYSKIVIVDHRYAEWNRRLPDNKTAMTPPSKYIVASRCVALRCLRRKCIAQARNIVGWHVHRRQTWRWCATKSE